jgi:Tfp pilus assembly protein PilX
MGKKGVKNSRKYKKQGVIWAISLILLMLLGLLGLAWS